MKFVWKGKFKGFDQLPTAELPEDAVKFKEPDDPAKLNTAALLYTIPIILIIFIGIIFKQALHQTAQVVRFNIPGLFLSFLTIFPHEFLHGICFPKGSVVEVYYSLKHMMAFVISTAPTTKARFIFLSALPNLVFGLIPFIVWIFLPVEYRDLNAFLFSFSIVNLSFGCGDYMNIFHAFTQMPKGSITQISGFHSYWYMQKNK